MYINPLEVNIGSRFIAKIYLKMKFSLRLPHGEFFSVTNTFVFNLRTLRFSIAGFQNYWKKTRSKFLFFSLRLLCTYLVLHSLMIICTKLCSESRKMSSLDEKHNAIFTHYIKNTFERLSIIFLIKISLFNYLYIITF